MNTGSTYIWAVIGAGPAGIAAVGKLLDQGVESHSIMWIDPEFQVGDFGTKWGKVSSNTRVELFLKFYAACHSFEYAKAAQQFAISKADPLATCELQLATAPLLWITDQLKSKVHTMVAKVEQLKLNKRQWEISIADKIIFAKNVIIATGADPKSMALPGIAEIPLTTALDPDKLAAACTVNDVVAVFGASHSAIIIIRSLLEKTDVKKVINFYLSPLRYAVYLKDWILFDDTGLKGTTAVWARENIDGTLPSKLQRVISSRENIQLHLPNCTKAIYATGFQRRAIAVEGMQSLEYNDRSGIIAPGLFGFGIGFPEAKTDCFGTLEYRVGLWKFMDYIERVLPVWMQYGA